MDWSWTAFAIGYLAGFVSLFFLLGVMHLGARNDEIQPSVEKKPDKRRDVH